MDLTTIISNIRNLTDETDTTQLSDSIITVFVNRRYSDLCGRIIRTYEDYFGTTATISTVASQQEYDLTQDANLRCQIKKIKRVEIAYDGTNYKLALPFDVNDRVTTESTATTAYSKESPYYYLFGNKIGFLPKPAASGTNNIKIWYIKRYGELASVSAATLSGSGLNDLTPGGTHTYSGDVNYKVQVDGVGSPNTFKWSDDGGTTWDAATVAMTGSAQTLNNGVTVTFAAITGHTLANSWTFTAYSDVPEVPNDYHDLLIYGASADIKKRDDNFAAASNFEADYENSIREMIYELKKRQIQRPREVRDVSDMAEMNPEDWAEDSSLS